MKYERVLKELVLPVMTVVLCDLFLGLWYWAAGPWKLMVYAGISFVPVYLTQKERYSREELNRTEYFVAFVIELFLGTCTILVLAVLVRVLITQIFIRVF
ncbi:hypothetical protein BR63_10185 [Thermanaerosceptrum fracticalcis]|uniref:Uncharacterized protein n=1 Tax=Thermanaerosceptrum fracticalcis TaxID=1712410 RepID=A0A7G6E3I5_THEFR|nr:hypothetical protein [Thermanaerosceptrum fracticalcis]QNB46639.1 hypothetical protein BR63_10185 [Thermanaerosceptrum fracticalcis]